MGAAGETGWGAQSGVPVHLSIHPVLGFPASHVPAPRLLDARSVGAENTFITPSLFSFTPGLLPKRLSWPPFHPPRTPRQARRVNHPSERGEKRYPTLRREQVGGWIFGGRLDRCLPPAPSASDLIF